MKSVIGMIAKKKKNKYFVTFFLMKKFNFVVGKVNKQVVEK